MRRHGRHDAVTHREDPGAEAVRKMNVVGGDQDCRAGVGCGLQRGRDCPARFSIESAGGLIDQEHLGVVQGLQRNGEDPPLSRREVPGVLVPDRHLGISPKTGKVCSCGIGRDGTAVFPACQASLGRAQLSGDRIPGEEVVRGIRHEGDPPPVDPAAVDRYFSHHSFAEGERHEEG
jgi:hypothetical protein